MDTIFTENDYKILKAIMNRGDKLKGLCKSKGTTIKEIVEKVKLSDRKVRVTLKRFEEVGYVTRAMKIGKADAFMLTESGMAELKSLKINIFGEVDK